MHEEWIELAKKLRLNESVRTPCVEECGSDDSQSVTHKAKGYYRYCFRCHSKALSPKGLRSIKDINSVMEVDKKSNELPDDLQFMYSEDVPLEAQYWSLKYGVSLFSIDENGWGWSSKHERIIIPVFDWNTSEYIGWQGRSVYEDVPKYISRGKLSTVLYQTERAYNNTSSTMVIVEDALSALKLGTVGVNAAAVLGSGISDGQLHYILRRNPKKIVTWFDSDNAGQIGAAQLSRSLRRLLPPCGGHSIENVITGRDPKEHTIESIREVLKMDA